MIIIALNYFLHYNSYQIYFWVCVKILNRYFLAKRRSVFVLVLRLCLEPTTVINIRKKA